MSKGLVISDNAAKVPHMKEFYPLLEDEILDELVSALRTDVRFPLIRRVVGEYYDDAVIHADEVRRLIEEIKTFIHEKRLSQPTRKCLQTIMTLTRKADPQSSLFFVAD